MRFNNLTDSDKEYISQIYLNKEISWETRIQTLSQKFECGNRTIEKWVKKLGLTKKVAEIPEHLKIAQAREYNKSSKRFIISWAQNNTPVHKEFLKNIEAYAKFINADIHIIAGRYQNPTSIWTAGQENEERWSNEVVSYLDAN